MLHLAIAYSNEDQSTASRIAAGVGESVTFDHYTVGRANDGAILADRLRDYTGRLVLLVSDNFLTNPNCMLEGEAILAAPREVLPVIIDGHRPNELTGEVETVRTKLATRSDVMHYVSHWQDRYIELRRGADSLAATGGDAFQQYLRKIRETSSQAAGVLEKLQERWTLTDAQFSADHYRQLFLFAEREDLWRELTERESQAVDAAVGEIPDDLAALPGLEWLATESEEPAATADPAPASAPPSPATVPEIPAPLETTGMASTGNETPAPPPPDDGILPSQQAANWIRRAWAMSDAGNTADGLDLLHLGRENFPDQLELHYQYALMQALGANDLAAARREVDALLDLHPDHPAGLFLSGELHEAAGNYIAARDDWEQVSDLEPHYLDINQRLGLLLVEHFPDDHLDAAAYLRRAVKHGEASAETYYHYARLLAGPLGRRKKATKMLRRAIKADPEHARAHYELAVHLFDAGHLEEARMNYQLAVSLEPTYDTPANRRAFTKSTTEVEALSALKRNIADLEAMLAEREARAAEPEPVPPRPGDGKTVLISGATSGIGLATARRLARDGYRLLLLGRRDDRLTATARELTNDEDVEVMTLELDVRDREGVGRTVAELPPEWAEIDILINNAGKAKGLDPIHAGDLDHWDEMIDVNLRGLLYLTRAVTPGMVARGRGLVINVASTAGKEVYPRGNVYCATKHAVDALTHAMRLDLVSHGVKVGQICPAHVEETEFALVRFDGDGERAQIYDDFQPLRSRDVAEAIHFMIDQPDHVNVLDLVLQGTQQASSTVVDRSGRAKYAPAAAEEE